MIAEVKPSTHKQYERTVSELNRVFGSVLLQHVTTKHVQDMLDALYHQGRAKSTIVKRKYIVQQIFRYANVQGAVLANPCSFARTPRKAPAKARRALTQTEIEIVIAGRNEGKMGFYAFMMLFTGLRRSELLALQWSDIRLAANSIRVNKVVSYVDGKPTIDPFLKNGDAERLIPIPQLLSVLLKFKSEGKTGLVFGETETEPMGTNAISWAWEKYRRTSGLEITQHMLRHTYCTMLYDAGVDVKAAAQLMGHRDITTTLSIYTHLEKECAAKRAVCQLDRYINAGAL